MLWSLSFVFCLAALVLIRNFGVPALLGEVLDQTAKLLAYAISTFARLSSVSSSFENDWSNNAVSRAYVIVAVLSLFSLVVYARYWGSGVEAGIANFRKRGLRRSLYVLMAAPRSLLMFFGILLVSTSSDAATYCLGDLLRYSPRTIAISSLLKFSKFGLGVASFWFVLFLSALSTAIIIELFTNPHATDDNKT
ncbi:MAG: hypothetical protein EXQ91_01130 [Alphaproteobacteria bacterium]|nr:hypothetical protein [Alphaproteobacteria bacterium]